MGEVDARPTPRGATNPRRVLQARAGLALRSVLAASPLLIGRRLRRDWAVIVTSTLLTALVFFLAAATPAFISRTADDAARQAVAAAGRSADLTVRVPVSPPLPAQVERAVEPGDIEGVADGLRGLLPASLAGVYASTTTTVLSPAVDVVAPSGAQGAAAAGATGSPADSTPGGGDPDYRVRFGLLTSEAAAALGSGGGAEIATGPATDPATGDARPIEAVISSAGASVSGLGQGDTFTITGTPPARTSPGVQPATPTVTVRIAATLDPAAASLTADLWADEPTFLDPTPAAGASEPAEVTVLLTPEALAALGSASPTTFDALLRLRFDPSRFSSADMGELDWDIAVLKANNTSLVAGSGYPFVVNSGFRDVAAPYFDQLAAARAQMVLVLAGFLGAGVGAMLLLGQLVALRRAPELALERARGSSFAAIGVRAVAEGALITLFAALVGVGCSSALVPGQAVSPLFVGVVAATGLVLVPLQAVYLAGGLRRRRAVAPRDRSARRASVRLWHLRRISLEATVVVAAAGAVLALDSRGVTGGPDRASSATEVDPLVALAPLLLALALGVLALRLVPLLVLVAARAGRRSTGALGVLGAASAGRTLRQAALLPLVVLVLGIGLAASGGFVTASVKDGQLAASLERIGADARVDGAVTEVDLAQVLAAPGVTRASRIAVAAGSGLDLGTSITPTTLVAVDAGFADLVAGRPAAAEGDRAATDVSLALLRRLSAESVDPDVLPVVVDSRVASQLISNDVIVSLGQQNLRLRVIGTTTTAFPGLASSSSIYVDLDRVTEQLTAPLVAGVLLVDGPGAGPAVAALRIPDSETSTRAGWLASERALPLVAGVETLFAASTVAFAALALIALVATALAGSSLRARDVSLLRTMGFRLRMGWWLAASELVPVVVGGLAGGFAAGVGIVLLLGPALELGSLTGGSGPPVLQLPLAVILALVGGTLALLVVAVCAEVLSQRRSRLIDVLRVGETV